MTAVFGSVAAASACVYSNPAPPQDPTARPDDTTASTASPTATSSGAPLAEIPKGAEGRVEKQADGTCLYVFREPSMDCPPDVQCNPGPPREPLAVKCPADDKTGP